MLLRRTADWIAVLAGLSFLGSSLSGCTSVSVAAKWPYEHPVEYEEEYEYEDEYEAYAHVPPGHRPPPGECRIWYRGTPPGQQPPPGSCRVLERQVLPSAVLVYGE